jgi:hypothetical protein
MLDPTFLDPLQDIPPDLLPSLMGRCRCTNAACRFAPVPGGTTLELFLPVSKRGQPRQIAVAGFPTVRCDDCGEVSYDSADVLLAEQAVRAATKRGMVLPPIVPFATLQTLQQGLQPVRAHQAHSALRKNGKDRRSSLSGNQQSTP